MGRCGGGGCLAYGLFPETLAALRSVVEAQLSGKATDVELFSQTEGSFVDGGL